MQGSELKSALAALDLSQGEFAAVLNVSRKAVNEWVNNKKPIDTRTELAVRYLLIKAGLESA